MTIKYSASARGFFDTDLHRVIPQDAVAVSKGRHEKLLAAQASGYEIVPDTRGRPRLQRIAPSSLAAVRATVVAAVKREAARRIDQRMPLWRQINALRDQSDPGFHEIDAIRRASNLIEQEIDRILAIEQLNDFPISAHQLWPAFDRSEIDS